MSNNDTSDDGGVSIIENMNKDFSFAKQAEENYRREISIIRENERIRVESGQCPSHAEQVIEDLEDLIEDTYVYYGIRSEKVAIRSTNTYPPNIFFDEHTQTYISFFEDDDGLIL